MGGSVAVTLAVIGGPSPGLTGYVSEAGSPTSPTATAYRLGVLGLAAALVLLAAALPAALRLATGLLAASGTATVLSAAVPCTAGCPLPPFDRPTLADLVHGGASIAGVAGSVFAMLAVALVAGAGRPLRRLSAVAAAIALPLSVMVGLAMLADGRGAVVGAVERLLLANLVAWALAAAITVGLARSGGTGTAPPTGPGGPPGPGPGGTPIGLDM